MNIAFLIFACIAFGIACFQHRWPSFPVHFGWVGAFLLTLGWLIEAAA